MKHLRTLILLLTAWFIAACGGNSGKQKIAIYVEPLYDSSPLKINIGKYSQSLLTNNPQKLLKLSEEFKLKPAEIDPVTMYVLAIRLYDTGEKDQSVIWFYKAQTAKQLFNLMAKEVDVTGAPAALDSFNSLSGKWINGYAGNDPDKWADAVEESIKYIESLPYIAQVCADYEAIFKPESEQKSNVQQIIDKSKEMAQWLRENKEDILKQRKANGVEGVY